MNNLDIQVKLDDHLGEDSLYEQDFVLWVEEQARLLRAQQFSSLDLPNLIEEIEAMARSNRRELRSRLTVLLAHLLKCQYQAEKKSSGWLGTIHTQRAEIADLLSDSPSLDHEVMHYADSNYAAARKLASIETGLSSEDFPAQNPYSKEQILDDEFVP